MDFDTFGKLPDGVGKVIGLTVVPLAASHEKCHVSRPGVSRIQLEAVFVSLSLVGWKVRWYLVEVGSFSHYFMRFFFHPRWLVGSLPSTVWYTDVPPNWYLSTVGNESDPKIRQFQKTRQRSQEIAEIAQKFHSFWKDPNRKVNSLARVLFLQMV